MRDSWWVDFRFNRQRIRQRSPLNTKPGAQAYEATLRSRLARGEPAVPPAEEPVVRKRLERLLEDFLNMHVAVHNKPTTQVHKRRVINRYLGPDLGHLEVESISSRTLLEYQAALRSRGLSAKTVNNILGILQTALRLARDWGEVSTVPSVKRLRLPPRDIRFLSAAEAQRLLADRKEPLWSDMVLLALHTGMRIGELSALYFEDVDLNRRVLTVRRNYTMRRFTTPKSNKTRVIPLSEEVVTMLHRRRAAYGLVFWRTPGTPVAQQTALKALKRMCRRAEVSPVGWHALRHTFASHLAMRGTPVRSIQALLGHASLEMTERYMHLAPNATHDAVDALTYRAEPRWIPPSQVEIRPRLDDFDGIKKGPAIAH